MAKARMKDEWERTAFLRYDIRNCFGGTGERPAELTPFGEEKEKRNEYRISDPRELAGMFGVT